MITVLALFSCGISFLNCGAAGIEVMVACVIVSYHWILVVLTYSRRRVYASRFYQSKFCILAGLYPGPSHTLQQKAPNTK